MTIFVKRVGPSNYECVQGNMRLIAGVELGKVSVTDIETHEQLEFHLVEGEIIELKSNAKVFAETIAKADIERVMRVR